MENVQALNFAHTGGKIFKTHFAVGELKKALICPPIRKRNLMGTCHIGQAIEWASQKGAEQSNTRTTIS
jgi:hypothetical protein